MESIPEAHTEKVLLQMQITSLDFSLLQEELLLDGFRGDLEVGKITCFVKRDGSTKKVRIKELHVLKEWGKKS